jgi:hypothetical protein
MCVEVAIGSISPDSMKVVVILCVAAVVVAGSFVYRILSGEKFGWFTDPIFKRPGKKEWQDLRNKAALIIEGKSEIDANELCELISTMQIEVEGYKRNKGTIEYEKDRERITRLSEKLEGMELRVEPFASLIENLKKDGLIEQADELHNMVHAPSYKSLRQAKEELLAGLVKIKKEKCDMLSGDTRTALRQSIKSVKQNPLTSIYLYGALIILGLGLRLYHSIVEDKGYEFYRKHPVWIAVFAVLIGVPALILVIKFVAWKYGVREKLWQSNLTDRA